MNCDSAIHHRQSIRLKAYDYSRKGAYFITLCTHQRECFFGEILNGGMQLNDVGHVVKHCWHEIPTHFPNVELDAFIIMPNHIHGIIVINTPSATTLMAKDFSPLHNQRPQGTSKTIGSMVRGFKIGGTKWIRQNTAIHDVWQRNFWDHVIRDEAELNRIREYIGNNPLNWELDQLNPAVAPVGAKHFLPQTPGVPQSNVRAKNFSPLQPHPRLVLEKWMV